MKRLTVISSKIVTKKTSTQNAIAAAIGRHLLALRRYMWVRRTCPWARVRLQIWATDLRRTAAVKITARLIREVLAEIGVSLLAIFTYAHHV